MRLIKIDTAAEINHQEEKGNGKEVLIHKTEKTSAYGTIAINEIQAKTQTTARQKRPIDMKDPWVQAFLSPKLIEKFREILLDGE